MTAAREKALDKVKKLLALANRPGTVAEGEAALTMAQALADKHGFKIRRVESDQAFPFGGTHRYVRDPTTARPRNTADEKKRQTEAKRKRTTYRKAYARGRSAFLAGLSVYDNPYDKHVWGVNLPGAWRTGWWDAQEGNITDKTPYDREAE